MASTIGRRTLLVSAGAAGAALAGLPGEALANDISHNDGESWRHLFVLNRDPLFMNVGTVGSPPREVLRTESRELERVAREAASNYHGLFDDIRGQIAPDLPEERILHLLSHARARILVTQPDLAARLPRTPGVWRVVVDDALLETKAPFGPLELPRQTTDDLAYVIYTSGSTGLPKGVMIDHRGAVNTILDINRRFGAGPADRVLALSALGFDLSVYDIFGLLGAGGAIVIPPAQAQRAPWEWADLMEQHDVSVWNTVPALMEAKLPSYMVPDRIVAMEAFPLTSNGKVDRNALPGG